MRSLNPNLAKINRSYTVEEVAQLLGKHKNTVREWIKKDGLLVSDAKKPMLILGSDLRAFIKARKVKNKRPCKLGEMYCVKCRTPRRPELGMVDYIPQTAKTGRLEGLCPVCQKIMNQSTSLAKLSLLERHMNITIPKALKHIVDCDQPIVNSDLKKET